MTNQVWWILGSALGGALVTWVWVRILYWRLDVWLRRHPEARGKDENLPATRIWWIPMWNGVFERGIVTTLMIWAPTAVFGFLLGWMALKTAIILKEDSGPEHRAVYFIGLQGSVVSIAIAVAAGVLANPGAVKSIVDAGLVG
jgi:hypothetical protein